MKNRWIAILVCLTVLLPLLLGGCMREPTSEPATEAPTETTTVPEESTTAQPDPTEATTEEPATDAPATQPPTTAAPATQAPAPATTVPEETQAAQPAANGTAMTSKGYPITEINGITYVDGIMIANKTYTLPRDYAPGDLTSDTYAAFYKMQNAAASDGIDLFILSGYRSYDLQTSLYNRYVASDGKAAADRYSARPGHSEHQTGYAMDLNSLKQAFADTAEGKWIAAHCHEYGFILRYPQGKEDVTGYMYEPWHLRYVGEARAAAIHASGLTLEEYYGITSVYGS